MDTLKTLTVINWLNQCAFNRQDVVNYFLEAGVDKDLAIEIGSAIYFSEKRNDLYHFFASYGHDQQYRDAFKQMLEWQIKDYDRRTNQRKGA